MNENICKHLHKIHSLQCISITEDSAAENLDINDDNDCEEQETKKDPYGKLSNVTSK